jgi:putative transposase
MNTVSRAYNSTDRPYIERLFGTVENVLVASLHGYTGRKPGHLPGYDAMASGVIDITEFRAILSKFFLDEYPRMRHFGVGMGGRRPIDVFRELNKTRGLFRPIDPTRRRVVLGIKQEVTPNDEGVRVFGGLWFNSDQLQLCRDRRGFPRKVSVYIDPDDLHVATVIAEGEQDPIDVQIQVTCFADLTLPQVIDLLTLWRKENPDDLEIHEDRLSQLRRERHELMQSLEKTRKVPRSYFTHPELIQMAGTVLRGARVIPGRKAAAHADSFAQPGQLMALPSPRAPSYPIAEGSTPIELTATDATDEANGNPVVSEPALQKPVRKPRKAPESTVVEDTPPRIVLGRPKNVKDLK